MSTKSRKFRRPKIPALTAEEKRRREERDARAFANLQKRQDEMAKKKANFGKEFKNMKFPKEIKTEADIE